MSAARLNPSLFALVLVLAAASPAAAQWTQVPQVISSNVFSVWANGDTIVAGADSATYVSTNAGNSWHLSTLVTPNAGPISSAFVRNGRLYAGTSGKGVFISDDFGDTWTAFNQGLVGGFLDTQLNIGSLVVRSDTLYAGTFGAGMWRRKLATGQTWHQFGAIFEPAQASNINDVALGGSRLLASAGGNGTVFLEDPGQTDWTEIFLDNNGLAPGLQAQSAQWWGGGWVVGTDVGVFRSATGANPWSFTSLGVGSIANSAFAARNDGRLFGAFIHNATAFMATSGDGGATWQLLEALPATFVYRLAISGTTLYAGRADGLWRRAIETVSVPMDVARGLAFASLGAQPTRGGAVNFGFTMPAAGVASIELYDVRGRRVGERVERSFGAGPQVASLNASALAPGVYVARLLANGETATARIVRTR